MNSEWQAMTDEERKYFYFKENLENMVLEIAHDLGDDGSLPDKRFIELKTLVDQFIAAKNEYQKGL